MTGVTADWNGRRMPLDEVMVPVLDRGHLFGDGVYEVVRIYDGRFFTFDEHWQRLGRSTSAIGIGCDMRTLAGRAQALLDHARAEAGSLYVQVTRGAAAKRTHRFPDPAIEPNVLMYVTPMTADPMAAARREGAAAITYPDLRWQRCDVKSLNLLGNVLANQAAHAAGALEAILFRDDGTVTEGSHTNAFAVDRRGNLVTTPLGTAILPGITRAVVLDLARDAGIDVREERLKKDDLAAMGEVFVTGTMSEIIPIVRLDAARIGGGEPGPVTRRLQAALGARIAAS